jgi:hypothetical protein
MCDFIGGRVPALPMQLPGCCQLRIFFFNTIFLHLLQDFVLGCVPAPPMQPPDDWFLQFHRLPNCLNEAAHILLLNIFYTLQPAARTVLLVVLAQLLHAASLEAQCSCGVSPQTTKIIGGSDAKLHEFPWQVSLKTNHTLSTSKD